MIALDHLKGRRVAVFGLGRTGLSAARALASGGARPLLWDDDARRRTSAEREGFELAEPARLDWTGVALLVLSPGVPYDPRPHPVVRLAREAGVEIVCDIELLQRAQPEACFVGVTGTNGKSTTTALIGHILQRHKMVVAVGGNIGRPALDLPALGPGGIYALELSSYQLDLGRALAFDVGVLTNITPDHLDRHGSMAAYAACKRKIFRARGKASVAVLGVDDEETRAIHRALVEERGRRIVAVAVGRSLADGVAVIDGTLFEFADGRRSPVVDLGQAPALPGAHNWQNGACAFAVARALGVPSALAAGAILAFPGLPHRIETVAMVAGVRFVNDSKATNADAAGKALACFERVFWIAGGRPKPGGLSGLESFYPRIAHAFLIGEAAPSFAETLKGRVPLTVAGTLARALGEAFALARSEAQARGSAVVLLSPACASFDQFTDYEARGEAFRRLCLELEGKAGGAARRDAAQRAAS